MENVEVAIIGAGPAGIGAAVTLSKMGIGPIALIDREPRVGGISARYTSDDVPTYVLWTLGKVVPGYRYAEKLRTELDSAKVELHLQSSVIGMDPETNTLTIVSPERGQWLLHADTILLACGARESSRSERGWIYGHRPSGVYFTTNLLDLGKSAETRGDAAVIGSEVMGYAAAAKLSKSGAKQVSLADDASRPRSLLPKRMFFYRWAVPNWIGGVRQAIIRGNRSVESIEVGSGEPIKAAQVAITGSLVPNSELVTEAGLAAEKLTRRVLSVKDYRIDDTSIFLAGNILGLSCSGQWAYWTGKWAAKSIAAHLKSVSANS